MYDKDKTTLELWDAMLKAEEEMEIAEFLDGKTQEEQGIFWKGMETAYKYQAKRSANITYMMESFLNEAGEVT